MKKNFDIAIIGSGLTGLTTSLALSSLNYKIALIDPKSLIFKKNMYSDNRTTAISSGSVDFYKKIGVWKELNKYACPIRKILVEEVTSENRSSFGSANKKESPMGFMIENQYLLKDTLNRLRIQELEIERLKKTGGKIDENFNNEIKELEKYVFVEYSDSL